jgi:glucose-6-phosphate 1-epimerase
MLQTIEQLNQRFGIPGQLQITTGKGGFPFIEVNNAIAQATICLYGGQILSYRPLHEPEDLFFQTEHAFYQMGKAIKGGAPICWPWFGPDPEDKGRPNHGFARDRLWSLTHTSATPEGDTRLTLELAPSPETQALWTPDLQLQLTLTLGESLTLALNTHNPSAQSVTLTQALHSYFRVGDIRQVHILGLDGREYIDKVDQGALKPQTGVVTIAAEVDRIYTQVPAKLVIEDAALERRILISNTNSATTVVWNPWIEQARKAADLADEDYQQFLCVETANIGEDCVRLSSGAFRCLTTHYTIERD